LKPILIYLIVALLAGVSVPSEAADPVVSNVSMTQRTDGSGLVDVFFDVSDADGDTLAVTLHLSDDGGATWDFPVLNVSGDVGLGVLPGTGRQIVWDAGVIPDLRVDSNYRAQVLASDLGVTFEPHSPDYVVITDFSRVDWSEPTNFELYSRADLLFLMGSTLWNGGIHGTTSVISELKSLNPNLKILGYVSVKSAQLSGASPWADLFWQEWLTRTLPFVAFTTVGDTASDFPGNVIINILEEGCRDAIVETIVEFQENSLNQFDGIYWDYFNTSLWVHPDVEAEGEPDLDGDGIGMPDDPDERRAYRAAQVSLIEAVRDTLGEDFIQFFNGQRAYSDSTFAALGDGMMYELFPTLKFPDPDMQHALDPGYEFNLFRVRNWPRTQNGGPFLVMGNTMNNFYGATVDGEWVVTPLINGNVFRAVALVTDLHVTWHRDDTSTYSNTYSWTDNDITLGPPLGPPVVEGDFIRRDFKYGRVEIEMDSGRYPNPFDYRIWCLGQLVEKLAVPFRFPPYQE